MHSVKFVLPLCAVYICSCSSDHTEHNHDHHAQEHDAQQANTHNHAEGAIIIEPQQAEQLGIVTAVVEQQQVPAAIKVTGQIVNMPSGQAVVSATGPGIVTLSDVLSPGNKVSSGQTVGRVSARAISGGDPNASALVALNAAKKEVERLKPLVNEGIVTRREYNAAVAAYEAARAAYSPQAASGVLSSPVSGIVTAVNVSTGQYVDAGTVIATIAKSDKLLLRLDLPDKYRASVSKIIDADFRVPQSDEWYTVSALKGSISNSAAGAMPVTAGFIPVYFTISNTTGAFAAGTFVDANILLSDSTSAVAIPSQAISEQYGNYFVYVKTGDHEYRKQRVEVSQSTGPLTQVTAGIKPGETIVVKGVAAMKLSETSGAVPEGHSHNH